MLKFAPPSKELERDKLYTHNGTLYREGPSGYAFYLDAKGNWRVSASITNHGLINGSIGKPFTPNQRKQYAAANN